MFFVVINFLTEEIWMWRRAQNPRRTTRAEPARNADARNPRVLLILLVVVVVVVVGVGVVGGVVGGVVVVVVVVEAVVVGGGRRAGRRKNALHCLVMKQKLPRLYGITVWDLRPLLSCCWGYSLGLFDSFGVMAFSWDNGIDQGFCMSDMVNWRSCKIIVDRTKCITVTLLHCFSRFLSCLFETIRKLWKKGIDSMFSLIWGGNDWRISCLANDWRPCSDKWTCKNRTWAG